MPIACSEPRPANGGTNGGGREVELVATALRRNYRDAVRLAAREEILAELSEDAVTAHLHADTARFHHGSAHAYARALKLLLGDELHVADDKQEARAATRESDLAPMRCQARRYRPFHPAPILTNSRERPSTG
jgi:hypothetical protein